MNPTMSRMFRSFFWGGGEGDGQGYGGLKGTRDFEQKQNWPK